MSYEELSARLDELRDELEILQRGVSTAAYAGLDEYRRRQKLRKNVKPEQIMEVRNRPGPWVLRRFDRWVGNPASLGDTHGFQWIEYRLPQDVIQFFESDGTVKTGRIIARLHDGKIKVGEGSSLPWDEIAEYALIPR